MAYPQSWTCPACGNTVYNSGQCTICTYKPKDFKGKLKKSKSVKKGGAKLLKQRILSFIIDSLIILGISLFAVLGFILSIYMSIGKDFMTILFAFIVPLISVPIIMHPFYFLFFEGRYNGQTYGKKILKIKVVRTDGSKIGFKESVIRNLVRMIEALTLYIISVVLIMKSHEGQRLGDIAAKTIVVSA